jgi:hypothetical protein
MLNVAEAEPRCKCLLLMQGSGELQLFEMLWFCQIEFERWSGIKNAWIKVVSV